MTFQGALKECRDQHCRGCTLVKDHKQRFLTPIDGTKNLEIILVS